MREHQLAPRRQASEASVRVITPRVARRTLSTVGMALVLALLVAACSNASTASSPATSAPGSSTSTSSPPPTLPPIVYVNDNTKPADARVGQTVDIRVETNPSTDYVWEVVSFDQSRLNNLGANFDDTSAAIPGKPVTQNLLFRAIAPGTATMVVRYTRANSPEPNDTTLTFTVKISA